MKTMILAAALLLGSLAGMAQVIRVDSRTGNEYAEIDSIPVALVYGCWATRMTLEVTKYTSQGVRYDWAVQYPWVVDSNTTDYYNIAKGTISMPIRDTSLSIGRAYKSIWQYAADSALLHGRFLMNVNYKQ